MRWTVRGRHSRPGAAPPAPTLRFAVLAQAHPPSPTERYSAGEKNAPEQAAAAVLQGCSRLWAHVARSARGAGHDGPCPPALLRTPHLATPGNTWRPQRFSTWRSASRAQRASRSMRLLRARRLAREAARPQPPALPLAASLRRSCAASSSSWRLSVFGAAATKVSGCLRTKVGAAPVRNRSTRAATCSRACVAAVHDLSPNPRVRPSAH
jgi:hypothetical protein